MKAIHFLCLILFSICSNGHAACFSSQAEERPQTPKAQVVTPFIPITPEKIKEKREEVSAIPEQTPLTVCELRKLIQYHNTHYPYTLVDHEVFNSFSDAKNAIKNTISIGEEFVHKCFLFKHNHDAHLSIIYLYKGGEGYHLFILDSLGAAGTYGRYFVPEIQECLSKYPGVFFYIIDQARQRDKFSCGLFTFNDLRLISRWLKVENKNPKEILSASDRIENNLFDRINYITVPPAEFWLPIQSLSVLTEMKKKHPEYADEFSLLESEVSHYTVKISDRSYNMFIAQQWLSVREIISERKNWRTRKLTPFSIFEILPVESSNTGELVDADYDVASDDEDDIMNALFSGSILSAAAED